MIDFLSDPLFWMGVTMGPLTAVLFTWSFYKTIRVSSLQVLSPAECQDAAIIIWVHYNMDQDMVAELSLAGVDMLSMASQPETIGDVMVDLGQSFKGTGDNNDTE